MPLRNTAEAYGSLSKFLHWAIVLLIVSQYFIAEAAEDAGKDTPERASLMGWHVSFGMLVLLLALVRIAWKIANKGQPAVLGQVAWQRKAATAGHGILYLLILLQPLSGWLVVSSGGSPAGFFGWFDFPALVAENHGLHEALEEVHEVLFNVLLVVAVVHVAAALYHHWVLRDATLRRMLPFARG
ncbi:MAG TPA: cytochrome b [Steroidobacteraceae bacterium]|nr:cytochrome b [Steroidobacteraceae bacterium]